MTRKDYQLIARCIAQTRAEFPMDQFGDGPGQGWDGVHAGLDILQDFLGIELRQDNPNFNPQKFAEACGGRRYWRYWGTGEVYN